MTLQEAYELVCSEPSDINEHCPTIRRLAEQCEHATEFGVRYGTSTTALLAGSINGQLRRLVSYDRDALGPELAIRELAPDVFTFIRGDTLQVRIDITDLLLIDTTHTGWHLLRELWRHHPAVRKWIVIHDTELFKTRGEKGRIGLWPAIQVFLRPRPFWFVAEHHENNCGLTILQRTELTSPCL